MVVVTRDNPNMDRSIEINNFPPGLPSHHQGLKEGSPS